jgi:CheY-like chemotaxis protein/nitrogen-specific signal transduction histidine kinase
MSVARAVEDRRRANQRQLEIERALAERDRDLAALAAERERRDLEAQLLQSQRLEALGRLAGGVAHDFNNLLGVIRNYATLVGRSERLDADLRDDVMHIEHAAARGAELTRELLLFSRGDPEGGGAADAAAVARTVVRMLSRSLGSAIQLRLSVHGATTARISPARLEQALVNLVLNARDAVDGCGAVDVSVHGDAGLVTVSVIDRGCGMRPEVVARAFEPFFTTKGPGEGSGLGLSTVYGIVERAGGRVRIESIAGVGTTIRLELLAVPEGSGLDLGGPVPGDAVDGDDEGVVAVVDDDPEVRALTVRMLEADGIDAVGFADGPTLLGAIERTGAVPRLVVTDLVMAEMDGIRLAQELWDRNPGLGVVFMSGYAPTALLDLDDPRASFLAKPFGPDELAESVRRRLGQVSDQPVG